MRIGVFVCRCGSNIAGTVDTAAVAERVLHEPNVVHSEDVTYSCSQPGQDAIKNAIHEKGLTRVVIASCSPRMHEPTFRRAVAEGGLNPYLMEMVNIREQCSWIHDDKEVATAKAIDLVLMGIERVRRQRELQSSTAPITKRALVIGGGVAGIQAALDIADSGIDVVLVERDVTIGGKMARLDKTFPTLDCSACILTPRMVEAAQHPNITLMTYSEVDEVRGYVGNFEVDIKHKAAYVDFDKCIGCGICEEKCPRKAPDLFNGGDYKSKAIYIPFPQAVPKVAVLRPEYCTYFEKGKCKVCQKFCEAGAIDYEQQDRVVTEEFGAIVVATGYDLFDYTKYYPEYGMGRFKNVISGLEYERLMCASGPTQGHIVKATDGEEPKTVVFVQCVGSRDDKVGRPYCSGVCCMYTAKQAIMTKEHDPEAHTYVFYIDIRAGGKGYEDFVTRAQAEYGVTYIRGRVAKIYEHDGKTIVQGEDTLLGEQVEIAGRPRGAGDGHRAQRGRQAARLDAALLERQLRLLHREPPQAAPGRDADGGRLPRRLRHRAARHPLVGRRRLGGRVQGDAAPAQGLHGDQPADLARRSLALHRLLQVRRGLPLRRHREGRGRRRPTRRQRALDRLPGLRPLRRRLHDGRHDPRGLHERAAHRGGGEPVPLVAETKKSVVKEKPTIVAFLCNWCSYAGADMAGTSRFKQPADIRIIRVPCSGRLDWLLISKAFKEGADGVLVSGCHPGDCHYTEGNYYARRKLEALKRYLPLFGIEEGRFEYTWVSASEGKRWSEVVAGFTDQIHALGVRRAG